MEPFGTEGKIRRLLWEERDLNLSLPSTKRNYQRRYQDLEETNGVEKKWVTTRDPAEEEAAVAETSGTKEAQGPTLSGLPRVQGRRHRPFDDHVDTGLSDRIIQSPEESIPCPTFSLSTSVCSAAYVSNRVVTILI